MSKNFNFNIDALRYVAGRPGVCRPADADVRALADRQLIRETDPQAFALADRYSPTHQGVALLVWEGRWES